MLFLMGCSNSATHEVLCDPVRKCVGCTRGLLGGLCVFFLLAGGGLQSVLAATPAYVQGNYATPQTPQPSVQVTYNAAQTAGNLNVVIVGWNDTTALVSSVIDTTGNIYQLAVGPTKRAGALSQCIYYAKNITAAPSGNRVTVSFSQAAQFADIRILEYSGIDPISPVDVVKAGTGSQCDEQQRCRDDHQCDGFAGRSQYSADAHIGSRREFYAEDDHQPRRRHCARPRGNCDRILQRRCAPRE